MIPLETSKVFTQTIVAEWLQAKNIGLDVLRLDAIDAVISGNKWFKLQYYLQEALQLNKSSIATFGGAWSNHIAATAAACKQLGLASIGIIRGEEPAQYSHTLNHAKDNGMQFIFVSREDYKNKEQIQEKYLDQNWYWIPEGGFGITGAKGAADILSFAPDKNAYNYIICAVGTGTTLAGLIKAASATQEVIGISSMKGNYELNDIVATLSTGAVASFNILHDYHFGGYGKHNQQLINFINQCYLLHQLPLDIVYTGKTMFAIKDLVEHSFFPGGSKILMVHTGGLQGNKSLAKQVLAF